MFEEVDIFFALISEKEATIVTKYVVLSQFLNPPTITKVPKESQLSLH